MGTRQKRVSRRSSEVFINALDQVVLYTCYNVNVVVVCSIFLARDTWTRNYCVGTWRFMRKFVFRRGGRVTIKLRLWQMVRLKTCYDVDESLFLFFFFIVFNKKKKEKSRKSTTCHQRRKVLENVKRSELLLLAFRPQAQSNAFVSARFAHFAHFIGGLPRGSSCSRDASTLAGSWSFQLSNF